MSKGKKNDFFLALIFFCFYSLRLESYPDLEDYSCLKDGAAGWELVLATSFGFLGFGLRGASHLSFEEAVG